MADSDVIKIGNTEYIHQSSPFEVKKTLEDVGYVRKNANSGTGVFTNLGNSPSQVTYIPNDQPEYVYQSSPFEVKDELSDIGYVRKNANDGTGLFTNLGNQVTYIPNSGVASPLGIDPMQTALMAKVSEVNAENTRTNEILSKDAASATPEEVSFMEVQGYELQNKEGQVVTGYTQEPITKWVTTNWGFTGHSETVGYKQVPQYGTGVVGKEWVKTAQVDTQTVLEEAQAQGIPVTYQNGKYVISANSDAEYEEYQKKFKSIYDREADKVIDFWSEVDKNRTSSEESESFDIFGYDIGNWVLGGKTVSNILNEADALLLPYTSKLPASDSESVKGFIDYMVNVDIFTGERATEDTIGNKVAVNLLTSGYTEVRERPAHALAEIDKLYLEGKALHLFAKGTEVVGSSLLTAGSSLVESGYNKTGLLVGLAGEYTPGVINAALMGQFLGETAKSTTKKVSEGKLIEAGEELAITGFELYIMGKASESGGILTDAKTVSKKFGETTGVIRKKTMVTDITDIPHMANTDKFTYTLENDIVSGVHSRGTPIEKIVYAGDPATNPRYMQPGSEGIPGMFATISNKYIEPTGSHFVNKTTKYDTTADLISYKVTGGRSYIIENIPTVASEITPELRSKIDTARSKTGNAAEYKKEVYLLAQEKANVSGSPVAVPSPKSFEGFTQSENEMFLIMPNEGTRTITKKSFAGLSSEGTIVQKISFGTMEKPTSVLSNIIENVKYNTDIGIDIDFGIYNKNYARAAASNMQAKYDVLYGNEVSFPGEYETHKIGKEHGEGTKKEALSIVSRENLSVSPALVSVAAKYHDIAKVYTKDDFSSMQHGKVAGIAIKEGYFNPPDLASLSKKEKSTVAKAIYGHMDIQPLKITDPKTWKTGAKSNIIYRPDTLGKVIANADKLEHVKKYNGKLDESRMFNLTQSKILDISPRKSLAANESGTMWLGRGTSVESLKFRDEKTKVSEKRDTEYEYGKNKKTVSEISPIRSLISSKAESYTKIPEKKSTSNIEKIVYINKSNKTKPETTIYDISNVGQSKNGDTIYGIKSDNKYTKPKKTKVSAGDSVVIGYPDNTKKMQSNELSVKYQSAGYKTENKKSTTDINPLMPTSIRSSDYVNNYKKDTKQVIPGIIIDYPPKPTPSRSKYKKDTDNIIPGIIQTPITDYPQKPRKKDTKQVTPGIITDYLPKPKTSDETKYKKDTKDTVPDITPIILTEYTPRPMKKDTPPVKPSDYIIKPDIEPPKPTKYNRDDTTRKSDYTIISKIVDYPIPRPKKGRTDVIPNPINIFDSEIYTIESKKPKPIKPKPTTDEEKKKELISKKREADKIEKNYRNKFGTLEAASARMYGNIKRAGKAGKRSGMGTVKPTPLALLGAGK